jgi:histidine triad (HIT) family protein
MAQTIFERIIQREIPATIEYEDDEIIAIRDIAPSAQVHVLIIPKRVIASVDAVTGPDAELIGKVFIVARDLARKFGIDASGYRVVTNTNVDAGQTVPHIHFHLLGGEPLGRMNSGTERSHASPKSGIVRDAGLIVACALGLAITFNAMNPKSIPWIKKDYERITLDSSEINKYLAPTPQTPTTAPAQTLPSAEQTAPATMQPVGQTPQPAQQVQQSTPEQPKFVPAPGVVREITYAQFKAFLTAGPYYLIDARGAEKYAEGHIANAVNFYGGEAEARIPDMLQSVPKDRVILIYCDGGECELSHHVADVLKRFAYGPIFIYTGGWAEWTTKK